jgi:hypothetical protein
MANPMTDDRYRLAFRRDLTASIESRRPLSRIDVDRSELALYTRRLQRVLRGADVDLTGSHYRQYLSASRELEKLLTALGLSDFHQPMPAKEIWRQRIPFR